jgi:hypothetical protein
MTDQGAAGLGEEELVTGLVTLTPLCLPSQALCYLHQSPKELDLLWRLEGRQQHLQRCTELLRLTTGERPKPWTLCPPWQKGAGAEGVTLGIPGLWLLILSAS